MSGDTRELVRGSGRVVVELECGVTVYPSQRDGEPWRTVWVENGRRRCISALVMAGIAE